MDRVVPVIVGAATPSNYAETIVEVQQFVRWTITQPKKIKHYLDLALQEGWSTATDEMREMGFGFGMGLPNIRKNSDQFSVTSQVGEGTVISSRIKLDGIA